MDHPSSYKELNVKYKVLFSFIILSLLLSIYILQTQDYKRTNDRLYINGQIIGLEHGSSISEAMYVSDGKISAIGTNNEILSYQSTNNEIYDLKNQIVLPGFIDSHSHVALSSFFSGMVDLSGFKHRSNKEVWEYLSKYIKTKKQGEWIVGKGIDSVLVKDLKLPTLKFLDEISPNNPVILISQSIHTYWANSEAFKIIGIDKQTASPSVSSFYEKDNNGNLSGTIKEQAAFMPFVDHLKKEVLTPKVMINATTKTLQNYAENGNTTVVSAGLTINDKKPLRLYEHLASEQTSLLNKLLTLVGLLPERTPFPRHFIYIRHDKLFLLPAEKQENDFYNILGVKHWYDGSPYTGSMYLKEPYMKSDLSQKDLKISEQHRGEALVSKEELSQFLKQYHNEGWQVAIHAQGDSANEEVLDVFEQSGLDFSQSRHRLEHSVLLTSENMTKLKELNMLPNFHINHLLYYGEALKSDLLGEERTEQILAINSAKKADLKFAMHADQPMFESKPFRLIQTAVERKTTAGNVIGAEQRISVLDAIKSMTIDAAYLINMEDKIGSLKEGKYADFIILEQNPFQVSADQLENIKVLKTFVNGNEVQF